MQQVEFKDKTKILILCVCSIIASVGLTNINGIYTTPICNSLCFSQNKYGIGTMLSGLSSAFSTLFTPKIVFKIGSKKTIVFGAILSSLVSFCKSFSSNIFLFYILNIIGGIAYSLFSTTVIFMIINYYFDRNTGFATSIVMCFSGLSASILSPLFAYLIELTNWRIAMRISGLICFLLCVPILLHRSDLVVVKSKETKKGITLNFGKDTSIVLTLCIVYSFAHFPVVFSNYLSSYGETLGLSLTKASLFPSLFMAGNVVGKLLNGYINDHYGALRSNIILICINCLASFLFIFIKKTTLILPVAFLFGSISSITGMGMSLIVKTIFGNERYADVFPIVSLAGVFGYSVFTPFVGAIYDYTGKYLIAIVLCAILDLVMIVSLSLINKKYKVISNTAY